MSWKWREHEWIKIFMFLYHFKQLCLKQSLFNLYALQISAKVSIHLISLKISLKEFIVFPIHKHKFCSCHGKSKIVARLHCTQKVQFLLTKNDQNGKIRSICLFPNSFCFPVIFHQEFSRILQNFIEMWNDGVVRAYCCIKRWFTNSCSKRHIHQKFVFKHSNTNNWQWDRNKIEKKSSKYQEIVLFITSKSSCYQETSIRTKDMLSPESAWKHLQKRFSNKVIYINTLSRGSHRI